MSKIKNGKKYDTETAKKLAEIDTNTGYNAIDSYRETLYQKLTGEYFIDYRYGVGAAQHRELALAWDGGNPSYGIFPVSQAQARSWIEDHFDSEIYEKLFEHVTE